MRRESSIEVAVHDQESGGGILPEDRVRIGDLFKMGVETCNSVQGPIPHNQAIGPMVRELWGMERENRPMSNALVPSPEPLRFAPPATRSRDGELPLYAQSYSGNRQN